VQGGIQATSRAYFAKLIPADNSGEYFGFFDIFGKFASVLGPMLYSLTKGATGRSSYSILSIILLFAVALVILQIGKKHLTEKPS
jgi:UMF1 family MFS transporter